MTGLLIKSNLLSVFRKGFDTIIMNKKRLSKLEREYLDLYGNLPDKKDELVAYIQDTYNLSENSISEEIKRIESIPWKHIELLHYIIPKPTPRPRYSSKLQGFYVKGASDNKKYIKAFLDQYEIICTRTEFIIEVYQPTPNSMSAYEKLLAEEGYIRPLMTADWDNLGKAYSDMLQDVLLINDCIITSGKVEKYFSIKPRIQIIVNYQAGFDCHYNAMRMMHTKAYEDLQESEDHGTNTELEFSKEIYDEELSKQLRKRMKKK